MTAKLNEAAGERVVDSSVKNPSRFTRYPNQIRHGQTISQQLLFVGKRLDKPELANIGIEFETQEILPTDTDQQLYRKLVIGSDVEELSYVPPYLREKFFNTK